MALPPEGVPIAAAMACVKLALMGLHYLFAEKPPETTGSSITPIGDE